MSKTDYITTKKIETDFWVSVDRYVVRTKLRGGATTPQVAHFNILIYKFYIYNLNIQINGLFMRFIGWGTILNHWHILHTSSLRLGECIYFYSSDFEALY